MIVGQFTRDDIVYTGQATLSNVEFVNCGQRGFTEEYDCKNDYEGKKVGY